MTFKPRNVYYLRISANTLLPLYLYLDERHIDWMSDIVLQHVLADLRPLVIPKLQAEKDIHFGPGAAGDKKGTVEVHRGETYQFAYFFRKTEPHSVVTKSRFFVAAPPCSEVAPVPAPAPVVPRLSRRDNSKKRRRTQPSAKHNNRKRAKTKGKHKASDSHLDEDILYTEESEQDSDAGLQVVARVPRRSQRQRRAIAGGYREYDEDSMEDADAYQDVDMAPPPGPFETNGESSAHSSDAPAERFTASQVKTEDIDQPSLMVSEEDEVVALDRNDQPSLTHDASEIDLVVEEEEEKKPKPLLKLKYQSFCTSGHCLCVVVEPWPLQRAATRLQSVAPLGIVSQRGRFTSSLPATGGSSIGEQRAQTPLFLPELDRAPSEAPYPRGRTLFHDDTPTNDEDDGYYSDDLMGFSQALNSTGQMHTNIADDDDDMDGAVLFGDADEVREFL
ncbi:hypothetical protein BS17DRAFT_800591 [Gyrodon lividus]|nr:hypothetical protein BS17DRAFT_800591 [Gyrodon lividus]